MSSQTHLISFIRIHVKNPWISVFPKSTLESPNEDQTPLPSFAGNPGRPWGGIHLPRPLAFSLRSFSSDDARKKMQTFQETCFFFKSTNSLRDGVGKWEKCFFVGCMFMHVSCWIWDITGKSGHIILWTLSLMLFFLIFETRYRALMGESHFYLS